MTGQFLADGTVAKWFPLDGEPTTLDGFTWKVVKHQPSSDRTHKDYRTFVSFIVSLYNLFKSRYTDTVHNLLF